MSASDPKRTVGFERSLAGGSAQSSGDRMSGLNMNALRLFLFLAMVMPVGSHAEEEKDEHSEIVEICIQAKEPGVCLKSYGYVCRQSRRFERSLEAYDLRCKLALPGGRYHYVQALYDDGGWAVENQHTYLPYLPEQDEVRTEAEDAGLALSNYVRDEMKSYRGQSGHSGSYREPDKQVEIQTGTRKEDKYRVIRALCAMTFE